MKTDKTPTRFVNPDWHLGPKPIHQSTSVIEVKMTDDDVLDVFDVVTGQLDGLVELVFLDVFARSKYVSHDWTPVLVVSVGPAARFPEDQAGGRVIDQDDVTDEVAAFRLSWTGWVGHERRVGAADEPTGIGLKESDLQLF